MSEVFEEEKKVDTYEITGLHYTGVDGACFGKLNFTGSILTCYPPLFVHKCDKCGKLVNLKRKYPYVDHRTVT